MKLGTVITATNTNSLYIDFIPMFVDAWARVCPGVRVVILVISDGELPKHLMAYRSNCVLINAHESLQGVHSAFAAQCIRLLYPGLHGILYPDEANTGVLITDMDMIPCSRAYYVDSIAPLRDDLFIQYRDVFDPYTNHEVPMCYNVALSSTWRELFPAGSWQELFDSLKAMYEEVGLYSGQPGKEGWHYDQMKLCKSVLSWPKTKSHFKILKDADLMFRRLDRNTFSDVSDQMRNELQNGEYTDYHMYRPQSYYLNINKKVLEALPLFNMEG